MIGYDKQRAWDGQFQAEENSLGDTERNIKLGRPTCVWENGIKVNLKQDIGKWTGFMWLRVISSSGLL
jgi:hypothetical protein